MAAPEEAARSEEFSKAYSKLHFESEDMPTKSLIGRVWREFSSPQRSVTTVHLKKMRSEVDLLGSRSRATESTEVAAGISFVNVKDEPKLPDRKLQTVTEVLLSIRIMTHLWALCGASLADSESEVDMASSSPGKVHQFHLETAILRREDSVVDGQGPPDTE